ncbi:MinD/ParA family protein [bacterium]|nr:MinD/ParA family protein [bacterium]
MWDQAQSLREQYGSGRQFVYPEEDRISLARKIAVTSGKGGVGKSNISLNLAIAIARLNKKVLLIDADTNLANIDILLGLKVNKTLADVVMGTAFFSEVLLNGPEGIKLLPGSSGMIEMVEQDSAVREKLTKAFTEFEQHYDVILIDTGAGLSNAVLDYVTGADDVVLVTNAEPTSITDAYAMVKVALYRNPMLHMHVIVNLAPSRDHAMGTFDKLRLAVRNFLQVDIQMLGFVPVDPNIPIAVAKQEPFITRYPRSAATNAVMMIARKLLKIQPSRDSQKSGFLTRIFQQKGS